MIFWWASSDGLKPVQVITSSSKFNGSIASENKLPFAKTQEQKASGRNGKIMFDFITYINTTIEKHIQL